MIRQDTTSRRTCADDVHSILSHPSRRTVLRTLAGDGGSGTVATVVERLAARADDERRYASRLELYHQHLPKLLEAGVVEFDEVGGRLTLTPAGRRVETVRRETAALLAQD